MKVREVAKLIVGLAAISFLNVACQGNLQSESALGGVTSEAVASPEELSSKVNMEAIQKTVAESETAMADAQKILSQFSNPDGSIKLWALLTSSSSSTDVESQSIFIIYEKLSEILNKVYGKVAEVKGKFGEARALLAVEAGKLDPANPAHQVVLQQIQLMMGQIDRAESQFSMALNQLAGQLDLVNQGIDMLTSSAGALFPGAGIIVSILTNQVKMAITEFQTKIRTL